MLVETIVQINVKPFLIEWPHSYCWKPLLYVSFIHIFLLGKAACRRSENVFFLTNSAFRLWKQYCFVYSFSFSLQKRLLALKPFSPARMKDLLKKAFPRHGKNLKISEKIATSRNILRL